MRRTAINAALALVSFALAGSALEAAVRWFAPLPPLPTRSRQLPAVATRPHFEPSIFAQNVLAASAHEVQAWTGARYAISAQGYRGRGFAWNKPDGVTRIAVYGGSSAFDIGRSGDDDWPSHAGRLLGERLRRPVEVINAAVPGHASFDNIGLFLAEGHRLSPDLVLLYVGWNDIKYFRDPRPILRVYHPYRVDSDPLSRPTGPVDALLAEHSHLYRFARLRWLLWDHRNAAEGRPASAPTGVIQAEQVRQFELDVATFVDLVRNAGAEPILVSEARLVAPSNTEDERKRIRYDYVGLDHEALVAAYRAVDDVITRVAAAKDVASIDAQAQLGGVAANFIDHVHLTPAGSDALAQLVAERLAGIVGGAPARAVARAEARR